MQNMEQLFQDTTMDVIQLYQQLQSSTQQLEKKEIELTTAKETIMKQEQQIREMVRTFD